MSTDTPTHVANLATQKAALPRHGLTLIGIAGRDSDLRALILLPSGKVITTRRGETTGAGTVLGIDATSVVLSRGGRELRLALPG
ncbi:hypothetical protein [Shimia sp.]|uniref:hypothetical protein n=1 Tax=Shimia sp. TaxID=1954381 RepID=UPI00356AC04E